MAPLALVLIALLTFPDSEAYCSGVPCARRRRGDSFDCVCNATYCDTIQVPENIDPEWFYIYTSSAWGERFDLQFAPLRNKGSEGVDFSVAVSTGTEFQEILGFGGALTDAVGYNLVALEPSAQANLLDSYFSKNGIEYSFLRVPIGGTDFSLRSYTNIQNNTKTTLVEEDFRYKFPYLREILNRNDRVRLLASAWEAPSWMILKDKSKRDSIKPEYYRTWAEYHKSFFDLYKESGIEFWGATTGNEVVFGVFSVPWDMTEHQIWINEHLGPVLEEAGYGNLKLFFLDDQTTFLVPWMSLLANNITNKYIDGAAVHWYLDDKIYLILDAFHSYFPDKLVLNTEACFCKYERDFEEKTQWYGAELYAENIIDKINSHSHGWLDWNLALDMDGGPNYRNNTCLAPITVNGKWGEFYKGPTFYAMGHFSKFVPPGSKRVDFSITPKSRHVTGTAFKIGDRPWDVAVVLLNRQNRRMDVEICIDGGYCGVFPLQARSIVTVIANATPE